MRQDDAGWRVSVQALILANAGEVGVLRTSSEQNSKNWHWTYRKIAAIFWQF